MRLTTKNITPYLVDKGFLSTLDLVNGDYLLTQTQSRNCIFLISLGTTSGLFVKQLIGMDAINAYLMQKDATVHHLIHHTSLFEDLKIHLPNYFGYDPNNHVFVTENFNNAQNLLEDYTTKQHIPVEDAKKVADILSSLHHDVSEEIKTNKSLQFFNREIPWMLRATEQILHNRLVLEFIQKNEFLQKELYKLHQTWEGNSLIHGDIKFVNFLKVYNEDSIDLKLIDWEIANIGDPLWDVAGFFQSYLTFWATSQPQVAQHIAQHAPSVSLWTLENCQKCTRAFWKQYVSHQGWTKAKEKEQLQKATRYTAARLLQTAEESNFMSPTQIQITAMTLIELAQNIFKSPIQAAANLLGITIKA